MKGTSRKLLKLILLIADKIVFLGIATLVWIVVLHSQLDVFITKAILAFTLGSFYILCMIVTSDWVSFIHLNNSHYRNGGRSRIDSSGVQSQCLGSSWSNGADDDHTSQRSLPYPQEKLLACDEKYGHVESMRDDDTHFQTRTAAPAHGAVVLSIVDQPLTMARLEVLWAHGTAAACRSTVSKCSIAIGLCEWRREHLNMWNVVRCTFLIGALEQYV